MCTSATHDTNVPTKHNVLCNGKSINEVMTQHPDFSSNK